MSKTTGNPNDNCLRGMSCPDCGSYGPFEIITKIYVKVSDDGTDDPDCSEMIFNDDDWAKCSKCNKIATWGYFKEESRMYTVVCLYTNSKGREEQAVFFEKAPNPEKAVDQCRAARPAKKLKVIQVFEGQQHGLV